MKIYSILIVVLFTATLGHAQDSNSIVGKWLYKSVSGADTLDEKDTMLADMLLKESSHYFNAEGRYSMFAMDQRDIGDWKVEADGSVTVTSDEKGQSLSLGIPRINGNELTLKVGSGEVIYVSSEPNEDDLKIDKAEPVARLSLTKEQLCKKWYLTKSPSINPDNKFVQDAMDAITRDSFFEFGQNGSYNGFFMGIEDKATWVFGENNETVIVTSNEPDTGSNTWRFVEVSKSKLVMVKNLSPDR